MTSDFLNDRCVRATKDLVTRRFSCLHINALVKKYVLAKGTQKCLKYFHVINFCDSVEH